LQRRRNVTPLSRKKEVKIRTLTRTNPPAFGEKLVRGTPDFRVWGGGTEDEKKTPDFKRRTAPASSLSKV